MRYAEIVDFEYANGEGCGCTLFVQGCHFQCEGCFNQETWDFDGGKEWTDDVKESFMNIISKDYIKRVSILGGEPMCDENIFNTLALAREIRDRFPNKKIWVYTGYDLDSITQLGFDNRNNYWVARLQLSMLADVVVDGRFEIKNQDLYNEHIVFAGSTNQRVIRTEEYFKDKLNGTD